MISMHIHISKSHSQGLNCILLMLKRLRCFNEYPTLLIVFEGIEARMHSRKSDLGLELGTKEVLRHKVFLMVKIMLPGGKTVGKGG